MCPHLTVTYHQDMRQMSQPWAVPGNSYYAPLAQKTESWRDLASEISPVEVRVSDVKRLKQVKESNAKL